MHKNCTIRIRLVNKFFQQTSSVFGHVFELKEAVSKASFLKPPLNPPRGTYWKPM